MTARHQALLLVAAALICFSCAPAQVGLDGPAYTLPSPGADAPAETVVPPNTRSETTVAAAAPGAVSSNTGLGEILNNLRVANAFWGVSVKSLRTGQSLIALNEDKLFVPASDMKLFTTAVALIRLGPDFRYTTSLYADGSTEKGVLKGDVYLRGSGDPTISERFQGRPTAVFEEWADRLKQQGIRVVEGDLIGDDTLFDGYDLGPGWAWDDEFFAFSARISAVSFNDNCFDTVLAPGKRPGDPARIAITPETSYVKIANNVKTSMPGEQTECSTPAVPSGRIHLPSRAA